MSYVILSNIGEINLNLNLIYIGKTPARCEGKTSWERGWYLFVRFITGLIVKELEVNNNLVLSPSGKFPAPQLVFTRRISYLDTITY